MDPSLRSVFWEAQVPTATFSYSKSSLRLEGTHPRTLWDLWLRESNFRVVCKAEWKLSKGISNGLKREANETCLVDESPPGSVHAGVSPVRS